MIGTMLGSIAAFGGIKETIESLSNGDGKVDISSMVITFQGLEAALISSIVALLMGTWVFALHHFNVGISVRLLDKIEQAVDEQLLPKVAVKDSQETLALNQLAELLGGMTTQIHSLAGLQTQTNAKLSERVPCLR